MYHGITLLSVPSKILNRVILNRLQESVDGWETSGPTSRNQERLPMHRLHSNTAHHPWTTYRMECIMEYINFIDFEKAFDSVDRTTLWRWMDYYYQEHKYINEFIWRNIMQSHPCKPTLLEPQCQDRRQTGMSTISISVPPGNRLDHEGNNRREEKWDPVDTVVIAGWPWLCRQHSSPYTHTQTDARKTDRLSQAASKPIQIIDTNTTFHTSWQI